MDNGDLLQVVALTALLTLACVATLPALARALRRAVRARLRPRWLHEVRPDDQEGMRDGRA